jgi:hypothetical protein
MEFEGDRSIAGRVSHARGRERLHACGGRSGLPRQGLACAPGPGRGRASVYRALLRLPDRPDRDRAHPSPSKADRCQTHVSPSRPAGAGRGAHSEAAAQARSQRARPEVTRRKLGTRSDTQRRYWARRAAGPSGGPELGPGFDHRRRGGRGAAPQPTAGPKLEAGRRLE